MEPEPKFDGGSGFAEKDNQFKKNTKNLCKICFVLFLIQVPVKDQSSAARLNLKPYQNNFFSVCFLLSTYIKK